MVDLQPGDYTALAASYAQSRPGYSEEVLEQLLAHVRGRRPGFRVADIGAGTGIWTKLLAERGLSPVAVEPNEAMREQGIRYTEGLAIIWRNGTAEQTRLDGESVDWVTMSSSFHWTTPEQSLKEFHRILRPGGHFTALWNPRRIEGQPLHERIEALIYDMVPGLTRVSSGSARSGHHYGEELISTGHFCDVVLHEADHEEVMSRERYLLAWRSVNDIQRQAGPERFEQILEVIAREIAPYPEILVPYRTRAWTARKAPPHDG